MCGQYFGLNGTVRDSRLLLALPGQGKEAVRAVQGEEDTRGTSHPCMVASEVGVGEQPEFKLVGDVSYEADFGAKRPCRSYI